LQQSIRVAAKFTHPVQWVPVQWVGCKICSKIYTPRCSEWSARFAAKYMSAKVAAKYTHPVAVGGVQDFQQNIHTPVQWVECKICSKIYTPRCREWSARFAAKYMSAKVAAKYTHPGAVGGVQDSQQNIHTQVQWAEWVECKICN